MKKADRRSHGFRSQSLTNIAIRYYHPAMPWCITDSFFCTTDYQFRL